MAPSSTKGRNRFNAGYGKNGLNGSHRAVRPSLFPELSVLRRLVNPKITVSGYRTSPHFSGQSSGNDGGNGAGASDELHFARLRQPPLPLPLARRRDRRGGRARMHRTHLPEAARSDQSRCFFINVV